MLAKRLITILAGLVILVDQLTKWLVNQYLGLNEYLVVIPNFFDLVNIRNRGAAFGFLNQDSDWQFWLFLGAAILATGIIYSLAKSAKDDDWPLFIGLGLVLGGALGNLIDRIRLRAVIDFLDFYMSNWHWPAFNVADVAICLGALFVLLSLWRNRK